MHVPIICPKILRIAPVRCPDTGNITGTWVEFEAVITAGNGAVTADLFIAEPYEAVVASIDRAGKLGAVLAVLADDADGINPVTGRRWLRGVIGPASELETPPVKGMILPPEQEVESCIFAPFVLRVYPAIEASPFCDGKDGITAACLDIFAGDSADPLIHVVITMSPMEARSFIENARIIRRPLLLWFRQPIAGCNHVATGKPVLFGVLDRLGTCGPATQ